MSAGSRRRRRPAGIPGEETPPVPVAEALTELGEELGFGDPRQLAALQQGWSELVGPAVAAHARVRSLRDGILIVVVDAAPWATELRYQLATIRARAAALLGADVVREVRVAVEPPR